eukprot:2558845-Pleurochrysis_carterae.AAC.3
MRVIEVYVRRELRANFAGQSDVVGSGRGCASAKVDSHPCVRIYASFGVSGARLDRKCPASEGYYARDARCLAGE